MEISLNSITLENFKGLRSYTAVPRAHDMVVRGDNGSGKTTLQDAFLWLLFGKDSQGRADFSIKTLDHSGQELHGLDHSVEAELDVDGRSVTLKKVFREKWTKKRGSPNSTLTGHTTEHAIDGVPVKKKDWDAKINELVDEGTFKLLTSPAYFNSLHWEKRRQILLQVCGDISDQEVIASNQDLAKLPEILGNRSLEDHRKVVKSRQQEINKRLQEIPARIDELSRSTQAADQYSPKLIKDKIQELEGQVEQAKSGGQASALREQRARLQADLHELQAKADNENRDRAREIEQALQNLQDQKARANREQYNAEQELEPLKRTISQRAQSIEIMRQKYRDLAAQEPSVDGTCPTCGQDLPKDQIQEAREKFNQDKADKLRALNTEGREYKEILEAEEAQQAQLEQTIQKMQEKVSSLDQEITSRQSELQQSRQQPSSYAEQIQELGQKIQALDQELAQENTQVDTSALEQELEAERGKLAEIEATKKSQARINELKEEEKKLAGEYEDLESQTYLMEQFIVSKVNMLEDKINSKFALARFKLFEEQINGGIQETCETIYQGVPYGSGLNNGARINVGLDIIRTLSEHYGVKVPVFVDNAEAVTELIDPGTQTIKMVVDGTYPELTIDNQNQHMEVVNG